MVYTKSTQKTGATDGKSAWSVSSNPVDRCLCYVVSVSHREVGRKIYGGGRKSIKSLLGRTSLAFHSTSATNVSSATSSSHTTLPPLPSFDDLESMADARTFEAMPSVKEMLDIVKPWLVESTYTDTSSPEGFFARIRSTLIKKLGYDMDKKEADRIAKKKRKELHLVAVRVHASSSFHC
jgi:hypothetical protein